MRFYLAGVVITTLLALPPGGTFIDDDGNVHEGAIEAVAAEGLTKGCNPPTNSRFCPDDPVTRAQMATFLSRALDLPATDIDHFVDDETSVHENDIDRLAAAGITLGCNPPDNDRFCPQSPMTRGEMAAMMVRGFGFLPVDGDRFIDDDETIFEESIERLAAAGITRGCNPPDNDQYCPQAAITRAQMATFLTGALELQPLTPPPREIQVVDVRPRESWGARPARTAVMKPHDPVRLTIHHAGTQSGTTGPAQFRGWQNWHMIGQGWGDIAYHLLIGMDGTVYEGRHRSFEGDTGTAYDTTGHFLVVLEGNFDIDEPTPDQLDSLIRVGAWASEEYGFAPSTISGHRDHAATACPGAHLHSLIESGELAEAVDAVIAKGGADLIWP